jgi:hypothetical protein
MKMFKCQSCENISDTVDEIIRNLEEWTEVRILRDKEVKALGDELFDYPYKFDPGDSEILYDKCVQEYFCHNCGSKIPNTHSLLDLQQYLEAQE